ncbi:hypothetical protein KKA17_00490 [bacterium]|nr:hypothetical protein [bacterium]MBU1883701.1 hypothetical protein [bacterium]
MRAKLFCQHCEKHYDTDLDNIRYVQNHKNDSITFFNGTYSYNDGCFFKTLNRLKQEKKIEDTDAK